MFFLAFLAVLALPSQDSLEELIRGLEGEDRDGVAAAIRGLARARETRGEVEGVDWAAVAGRITELAASGDPVALEAIPVLGDARAIPMIVDFLKSSSDAIRRPALGALAGLVVRRPELVEYAQVAELGLASGDPGMRRQAYETLALAPDPKVDVARVRRALTGELPVARWGALELAASLGDRSLAADVARLLPERDGAKAVEALFRISADEVASRLEDCLRHHRALTEAWVRRLVRLGETGKLEVIGRALPRLLAGSDHGAREMALRFAEWLDIRFDAESIAAATRYRGWSIRVDAFSRIGSVRGKVGLDVLRAGLRDREAQVRKEAVKAVGRVGAIPCRDGVLKLLDGDAATLAESLGTLSKLGDREALPRILPHLLDRKHAGAALDAVDALATKDDVPRILEMAREMENPRERRRALRTVARLLDKGAVETLRGLLADRGLRGAALSELAERDDRAYAAKVVRYLSDSDVTVARAAADLVGRAGRVEAIPQLVLLLRDRGVASAAARALSRMKAAASEVAGLLADSDADLRRLAAWILNALDADELAERVGDLLGDASPEVATIAVETVHRRRLAARLDDVEKLSRRPEESLARAALETLVALDWKARRGKLLERLRGGETRIAPFFAALKDAAAVAPLLALAENPGEGGYDALRALNAFRAPEAYVRATERKFRGLRYSSWFSPWQEARRIAKEAGVAIRVEIPLPPFPEIELDRPYREGLPNRAGGGGDRIGSRTGGAPGFSLLEKLRYALGAEAVPVIGDDGVRLLPRALALDFWRTWIAQR